MLKNRWKLSGAGLLLCAAALILPGGTARAQPAVSPFIVDVWTSREGLPENAVISVIQTRDGYLWLGTLNGLVRFDGNRFTVFNEFNTPGLTSDRVVYLFEDSRTNLWLGWTPPEWLWCRTAKSGISISAAPDMKAGWFRPVKMPPGRYGFTPQTPIWAAIRTENCKR